MQGEWLNWSTETMQWQKFTYAAMCNEMSVSMVKYLIQAQGNCLADGSNLVRWKVTARDEQAARCPLCGAQKYTAAHVLCACPWVLNSEEAVNGVPQDNMEARLRQPGTGSVSDAGGGKGEQPGTSRESRGPGAPVSRTGLGGASRTPRMLRWRKEADQNNAVFAAVRLVRK